MSYIRIEYHFLRLCEGKTKSSTAVINILTAYTS